VALAAQARAGSSFRFWRPVAAEAALNSIAIQSLELVDLSAGAHRLAGSLSHGEKRRLELAMALAHAPKLLLLDEPMAGAGIEDSQRLLGMLRGLKRRYSMLLVEHDIEAVFALADRISVLVAGRIIATGEPQAVRADPAVRAAYLGEAA
jgi:branched-chain amino acid transport system ATP-binding protein